MRNNPTNVRLETLQSLFLRYGFVETAPSGGSSHYTYHKGIYRTTVVKNKPVNKIYVKRAIEIIDIVRKLEEEP